MELFEAIQRRFSYRGQYQAVPVPREHLRRILEAGLAAPSGCNKQSARLVGVDDPALVARLGEALKLPNFASAPAAICVFSKRIPAHGERTYGVQDYSAAIENMLLAISALSYASCWVEGYITDADQIGRKLAALLCAPEDAELVAYLPVGLPAEDGTRASKQPFEKRAWFNGYGEVE